LKDTTHIEERKVLKDFITAATGLSATDLKQRAADIPGAPRIIIVSGAALRVADVVRLVQTMTLPGTLMIERSIER
jgi:hypothetical protein